MSRTTLEWLGLELALNRYMHCRRGVARLLVVFMKKPGALLSSEYLMAEAGFTRLSLRVMITYLREALDDLGIPATIRYVHSEKAYRLSAPGAEAIWSRVGRDVIGEHHHDLPRIAL